MVNPAPVVVKVYRFVRGAADDLIKQTPPMSKDLANRNYPAHKPGRDARYTRELKQAGGSPSDPVLVQHIRVDPKSGTPNKFNPKQTDYTKLQNVKTYLTSAEKQSFIGPVVQKGPRSPGNTNTAYFSPDSKGGKEVVKWYANKKTENVDIALDKTKQKFIEPKPTGMHENPDGSLTYFGLGGAVGVGGAGMGIGLNNNKKKQGKRNYDGLPF